MEETNSSNSAIVVSKDSDLKMYHVMSVKQSFREDLAEHSYQFSCRATDWSCVCVFAQVPMQFEPVELHVVDAFGQQRVPEYFQQPARAITEDVMRGPQAQAWIQAVMEEFASFKKLGVYEEVPTKHATSIPSLARLILVTKPNIHGGAWETERDSTLKSLIWTMTSSSLDSCLPQDHHAYGLLSCSDLEMTLKSKPQGMS